MKLQNKKRFQLQQRVYAEEDRELYGYQLLSQYTDLAPYMFLSDISKKIILLEDLNENYIQGFYFDENNEDGEIIRCSYQNLMEATAKMHATFWEKNNIFMQIGLDWRHETVENLLSHISGMEKDFNIYRQKELNNEIPRKWE